jgi:hypothetical protein
VVRTEGLPSELKGPFQMGSGRGVESKALAGLPDGAPHGGLDLGIVGEPLMEGLFPPS